jgi:hypothetical protein
VYLPAEVAARGSPRRSPATCLTSQWEEELAGAVLTGVTNARPGLSALPYEPAALEDPVHLAAMIASSRDQ